jgi:hypothetical protein
MTYGGVKVAPLTVELSVGRDFVGLLGPGLYRQDPESGVLRSALEVAFEWTLTGADVVTGDEPSR